MVGSEQNQKRFNLTSIQESILSATRLTNYSSTYNVQVVVDLKHKINHDTFKYCWGSVCKQYEHFRARLVESKIKEREYDIVIGENADLEFIDIDLSNYEDSQKCSKGKSYIESVYKKSFLNIGAPLFGAMLLKYNDAEYKFVITFNHILFDGRSFVSILSEFFNSYDATLKCTNYSIKPCHYRSNEKLENLQPRDEEYWKKRLGDYDDNGALCIYHSEASKSVNDNDYILKKLTKDTSDRIKAISRTQRIIPNILFETLWAILLSKYLNSNDVLYSSILSTDQQEMGLFINSLPIRCKLEDGHTKLIDIINQIRQQYKEIKHDINVPIKQLLKVAGIESARIFSAVDYKPISPLCFLKLQGDKKAWRNRSGYFRTDTHYDLFLEISRDSVFEIKLSFKSKHFKRDDIEKLFSYYIHSIDYVTKGPIQDITLKDIALEMNPLMANGQKSTLPFPNYIFGFLQMVNEYKNKVAVTDNLRAISYTTLCNYKSNALHHLTNLGVSSEDVVILHLDKSCEMIALILALSELGATYLPTDANLPNERLRYIINDSGAQFILSNNLKGFNFDDSGQCKLISIKDIDIENNGWTGHRFYSHDNNGLAYMIYTSGSTGKPKGVKIRHHSLLNLLLSVKNTIYISSNDVVLSITSIGFDISGLELLLPIISGAKLVIASDSDSKDPYKIIDLINKYNITILQATPSMWMMLLDAGWKNDGTIKVLCGGEALDTNLAKRLTTHGTGFWHCYGPTETTIWSSICYVDKIDERYNWVPFGRPISNTSLFILDKCLNPLPENITGELYISGDGLSEGYINKHLTNERFVNYDLFDSHSIRLYKTGDLAAWTDSRLIEFKGRIDEQIKINGYRIEVGEIEFAIAELDGVKSCTVLPVVRHHKAHSLQAFIILNDGHQNTEEDIIYHLSDKLPHYMLPAEINYMDEIPLNANGKVDKIKLKNYKSTVKHASHTLLDESLLTKVKNTYASALDNDEIDENANFFALGGDSLSAFRLKLKIENEFSTELDIKDIYNLSVLNIVNLIENDRTPSKKLPIKPNSTNLTKIPLTDFQKRLWIINKLNDTNAYNVSMIIKLHGNINIRTFKKAIEHTVRQHDAFFIKLDESHGNVTQSINKNCSLDNLYSFALMTGKHVESSIKADLDNKQFNLSGDQLLYIKLIRSESNIFYLSICAHHAVLDEWSAGILFTELSQSYNAILNHKTPVNITNKTNYLSFVYHHYLWKNKSPDEKIREKNFWRKYLANYTKPEFQYDFKKPNVQTFAGDRVSLQFTNDEYVKIKDIINREKITLTALLLSAIKLTLYCYTENSDILIGIPVSMRKSPGTESLVGPFVNTLPIRSPLDLKSNFTHQIASVNSAILDVISHSNIPFERIVDLLNDDFDASENPVYQIFMTVQQDYAKYIQFQDASVKAIILPSSKSKFNLSFYFSENNNGLLGEIEFRSDLFKPSTITRLKELFIHIVRQTIHSPNADIKSYHYTTVNELRYIKNNNATDLALPDCTIIDIIKNKALSIPNNIAIQYKTRKLSYSQLETQSDKLASLLASSRSLKDHKVGILLHKSLDLAVAILAALKSNQVYIPLDPSYPIERVKYFIEHSQLKTVICNNDTIDYITLMTKELKQNIDIINLSNTRLADIEPPIDLPISSNLAYIIYTSGSTGNPKGVSISHKSLLNFITGMNVLGLKSTDNLLSITPISFDIFGLELFLPLSVGGTVTLEDYSVTSNPTRLKDKIDNSDITVIQATPVTWRALLAIGWEHTGAIKVICGGEALDKKLAKKLLSNNHGFYHCYGPTETTIWSTCTFIDSLDERYEWVDIGTPIANTKIYILNQDMQLSPIGVEGDIYIAGEGVANGYYNNTNKTDSVFLSVRVDNIGDVKLYKTGDRGLWSDQGKLVYLGRKDQQIKLNGNRIEIGEIESRLSEFKSVKESAVTLIDSDQPFLAAYIAPEENKHKQLDISLFFFPSDELSEGFNPYELCLEATKYADEAGFKAVWTPERHFNKVAGQFPNPSILAAALSQSTNQIQLRAGSLVLPLHNPVRVAEDWAVIDNLSKGRAGLAFATGWHPQDFVLNSDKYTSRKEVLLNGISTIKSLWENIPVELKDGNAETRNITIYPKPIQPDLPMWITAASNPETFRLAGETGCNLLTHLLGQDVKDLTEKIKLYRETLKTNGFDPNEKIVTLVVHTYIDHSHEDAVKIAKPFFSKYLKSHSELLLKFNNEIENDLSKFSDDEIAPIIDKSLQRFISSCSLIGDLNDAKTMLGTLSRIDVDEIACLIDFGISKVKVLNSLKLLHTIKNNTYSYNHLNTDDIKKYLSKSLPSYMVPKKILQVDSIPKTVNNKIDRSALKKINITSEQKAFIPAKTDNQIKLVEIINGLYKTNITGLEANLDDLGGSSIIAVQLLSEIEMNFSVKMSIGDIIESINIADLAEILENKLTKNKLSPNNLKHINPIVTLRKASGGIPLILIHPVGGTVFCYRQLANLIDNHVPVYGIQDPGILANDKIFSTIDEMADFYLNSILQHIPANSFIIAGSSFGGTLALEVASKLSQSDKFCSFVALLDTWAIFPEDLKRKAYFENNMKRQHEMLSSRFNDYNAKDSKSWLDLQWHRQELLMEYRPHNIDKTKVTLYKAIDLLPEYKKINEPSNYWREYLKKFSIEQVPGTHESLLKEPNVAVLANKINSEIAKVLQKADVSI